MVNVVIKLIHFFTEVSGGFIVLDPVMAGPPHIINLLQDLLIILLHLLNNGVVLYTFREIFKGIPLVIWPPGPLDKGVEDYFVYLRIIDESILIK